MPLGDSHLPTRVGFSTYTVIMNGMWCTTLKTELPSDRSITNIASILETRHEKVVVFSLAGACTTSSLIHDVVGTEEA